MAKERIYSLDAVRGISALLIVFYHVSVWQNKDLFDGGSYLTQKLGIYMVAMFYLLSGISMGYIYQDKFKVIQSFELKSFFLKRYFRIAPLYCLLCVLSIWVYSKTIDAELLKRLAANFSLLFGLVEPGYSMLTGGWSIGVEFFFYLFFPFLLWLSLKNNYWSALILVVLGLFVVITAILLESYSSLPAGWKIYSYPLNHFLYFWIGVMIPRIKQFRNHWGYLAIGVLLFIFSGWTSVPDKAYSLTIVTGLNRVLLSVSVILIVFYFYQKVKFNQEWLNHWSDWLASVSFSLYLLHPFVYYLLMKYLAANKISWPFWYVFPFVLIVTVLIGRAVYCYEKYFVELGAKLLKNNKIKL